MAIKAQVLMHLEHNISIFTSTKKQWKLSDAALRAGSFPYIILIYFCFYFHLFFVLFVFSLLGKQKRRKLDLNPNHDVKSASGRLEHQGSRQLLFHNDQTTYMTSNHFLQFLNSRCLSKESTFTILTSTFSLSQV